MKWTDEVISETENEVGCWCNICKILVFSWWPLHNIFISLPHTFQLHWRETKQAVCHIKIQGLSVPPPILELGHRRSVCLLHLWLLQSYPDCTTALAGARCKFTPYLATQRYVSFIAKWHYFLYGFVTPETVVFIWILSRSPPTLYFHHLLSQHNYITLLQVS